MAKHKSYSPLDDRWVILRTVVIPEACNFAKNEHEMVKMVSL